MPGSTATFPPHHVPCSSQSLKPEVEPLRWDMMGWWIWQPSSAIYLVPTKAYYLDLPSCYTLLHVATHLTSLNPLMFSLDLYHDLEMHPRCWAQCSVHANLFSDTVGYCRYLRSCSTSPSFEDLDEHSSQFPKLHESGHILTTNSIMEDPCLPFVAWCCFCCYVGTYLMRHIV